MIIRHLTQADPKVIVSGCLFTSCKTIYEHEGHRLEIDAFMEVDEETFETISNMIF